jgi:hypothetical protein
MEVKLRVLYSKPGHSQVSAWILSKPVTKVINPIYKVCRIQVLVKQKFPAAKKWIQKSKSISTGAHYVWSAFKRKSKSISSGAHYVWSAFKSVRASPLVLTMCDLHSKIEWRKVKTCRFGSQIWFFDQQNCTLCKWWILTGEVTLPVHLQKRL